MDSLEDRSLEIVRPRERRIDADLMLPLRDRRSGRYCGGAFGSAATFGTLSAASAPGQPPVTLLKEKLISGEDL